MLRRSVAIQGEMEEETVSTAAFRSDRTSPKGLRFALMLSVGALALLLPACEEGGHFTILGYTTRPNYDPNIHTVYVPVFKNITMYRGLEFTLTRAVVTEIEHSTPFRVVSDRDHADTELLGSVTNFTKGLLNMTQLNEQREVETTLTVEIVWRDLHTGEILSLPPKKRGEGFIPPPPPLGVPATGPDVPGLAQPNIGAPRQPQTPEMLALQQFPTLTPPPTGTPPPEPVFPEGGGPPIPVLGLPKPVIIQTLGHYIPEIGGSITSAQQENFQRAALQIVHMMEKPW